jgi:hypothetical protein
MRKVIFMLAVVLLTLIVGCTKEREIIVVVPNVEVQLNTKQVFNVEEDNLFRSATTRSSYEHEYPTKYKAYFVSNENKGDYTAGQVVKTIIVEKGLQEVVVPALSYTVYVTNYEKEEDKWYTWLDALEQLPPASNTLYLFGSNEIDYKTAVYGEVEVKNPYAAVMIQDIRIPDAPTYYGNNTSYELTSDGWWLKYIRGNTTNTGIFVKLANENRQVTINDPIEANKIYKYTLLVDALDVDGNFKVVVEEFEKGEDREIEVQ